MSRALTILSLITTLASYSQAYEVEEVTIKCDPKEIEGFNTKSHEFSPYVFDNVMYFTSSREFDMNHFGENNWKRTGYLNVFQAEIKGEVNENSKLRGIQLMSEKIKSDNHTGPLTFSQTGDTIFFSQINNSERASKKAKVRPQLYMSVRRGSNWSDPVKLSFNDPQYSFGHPNYDSKSGRLYFASDMKGGKGGKDIYYSEVKNGQWSKPTNVAAVNTSADDLYPFLQDGTLFFSSNRGGGKGGLDIYWKQMSGTEEARLLEGINGENDDFGIYVFPGMTKGYFSSNRSNPENDDIFFLYMEKAVTYKKEIAGNFTYRNLSGSPSNLKLQLVGEDGQIILETATDENGDFVFRNLDYDGSFKIRPMTDDDLQLILYDKDGNPVTELMTDEFNEFTYKKLNGSDAGYLSLIPDDMIDLSSNTGHLSAQFVYESFPGKYPVGMTVKLRDENGNVKETTLTDKNGNFEFKKLDMAKNYVLHMDDVEEPLVLLIFDSSGNVVAQMKTNEKGDFIYRKLDAKYSDNLSLISEDEDMFKLETQTVAGQFVYKNLSGAKAKDLTVFAYSDDGIKLGEVETDEDGYFRFRNLPPSTNLLFKVDETDPDLHMDEYTLFIFDRDGKKVASLKRGQGGYFIYKPLGFDDSNNLSTQNDNADLNLTLKNAMGIETVYFGSNATNVQSSDLAKLNKIASALKADKNLKVEVNAYADSRSSDEYNLILSQKRGDWVVDYLRKKGVSSSRFIVNAYGEARLVDETKHELNRRAEIRVYK